MTPLECLMLVALAVAGVVGLVAVLLYLSGIAFGWNGFEHERSERRRKG